MKNSIPIFIELVISVFILLAFLASEVSAATLLSISSPNKPGATIEATHIDIHVASSSPTETPTPTLTQTPTLSPTPIIPGDLHLPIVQNP